MEISKPASSRVKRRNSIKQVQDRNIFHGAKCGRLPPATSSSQPIKNTSEVPFGLSAVSRTAPMAAPRKGSKEYSSMSKYMASDSNEDRNFEERNEKKSAVNTALNSILTKHISAPSEEARTTTARRSMESARGSVSAREWMESAGVSVGGSIPITRGSIGEGAVLPSAPPISPKEPLAPVSPKERPAQLATTRGWDTVLPSAPPISPKELAPVSPKERPAQPGTSRDWDLCRPLQERGRSEVRAKEAAKPNAKPPRVVTPECGFLGSGIPVEKAAQNMPTKPEQLLSKKKKRPDCQLTGDFEFKPPSRSSSENSEPNTPQHKGPIGSSSKQPILKMGRRTNGDEDKDSRTSSIVSGRSASSTTYVNFDSFDLQIENGRAPSKILGWEDLPIAGGTTGSSVRQCIEWYGWERPTKFQGVAIPSICQACQHVEAKSYTLLQANKSLGKTSALVLSLLASVKPIRQLQFVVVALDACKEIDTYLSSLGVLCPVQVACLDDSDDSEGQIERDVAKLSHAQILVGHPERVSAALALAQVAVDLEHIQALVIDDASEIIAGKWVEAVCGANQLLSCIVRSPMRYIVLSNFIANEAKPALRALKSSLMSKKNMFDLSVQVGRVKKFVKHYDVPGDDWKQWLHMLLELQKMIFIPRAVIFCDDETKFRYFRKQIDGMHSNPQSFRTATIGFNVAIMDPEESREKRREALSAFMSGKKDFLLTKTEPNVFQLSMPRVFWVINFSVEQQNLAWYGCRLLCLDDVLRGKVKKGPHQDGVSILFHQTQVQVRGEPRNDQTVQNLQKMFQVKFESLPFGDLGGLLKEKCNTGGRQVAPRLR